MAVPVVIEVVAINVKPVVVKVPVLVKSRQPFSLLIESKSPPFQVSQILDINATGCQG